jgi:hypothetical protein
MTSSFLLFECISGSRYRGRNESLQTRDPIATLLRTASEPHAVAEYASRRVTVEERPALDEPFGQPRIWRQGPLRSKLHEQPSPVGRS